MLMRLTPHQCPTCRSDASGLVEHVLAISRVVPVSGGCFEYATDAAERTRHVPDVADRWDNVADYESHPNRYAIDYSKFMEIDWHSHEPQRLRSKWWGAPSDDVQLRCDTGDTWRAKMRVV